MRPFFDCLHILLYFNQTPKFARICDESLTWSFDSIENYLIAKPLICVCIWLFLLTLSFRTKPNTKSKQRMKRIENSIAFQSLKSIATFFFCTVIYFVFFVSFYWFHFKCNQFHFAFRLHLLIWWKKKLERTRQENEEEEKKLFVPNWNWKCLCVCIHHL